MHYPLAPKSQVLLLIGILSMSLVTALRADQSGTSAMSIEDRALRSQLPEFKYIPAAKPAELASTLDPKADTFTNWTRSQGDSGSRRYTALSQINRTNIKDLVPAWTFHSKDTRNTIECTPIIVKGVLYAPTSGRAIVALDAATGIQKWRYQVELPLHPGLEDEPARRGLVYWQGNNEAQERIIFGSGYWIYALNPVTGKLISSFGTDGRAPIETGATAGGVIYKDIYAATGLYGDVYGFNIKSGKLLWHFHTVAQAGEFGANTWQGNGKNWQANCWGGLSLDEKRGMAFVAVGAAQPNFIGVNRKGDNLFSNCVVALDISSGKLLWHYQNIHHDIWDLDTCAPPNLVTITREGKQVDAVTSIAKAGTLVLLDRVSGKPIFPIRLRRAPTSQLPGETTAPYQPDYELPELISSEAFSISDITNRTQAAHDYVAKIVERSSYGWFQPFVEGKANIFIGTRGGAEWSGAAVDVPTGRLYVTSNRIPSIITVFTPENEERDPHYAASKGETLYLQNCAPCHGASRLGTGMVPPLISLHKRMTDTEVMTLLKTGRAAMPAALTLDDQAKRDVIDFLFHRNQPPVRKVKATGKKDGGIYSFTGYNFLLDNEGYPGIKPPWGLLNCYDLSTGKVLWRVPLGEYPELTAQGVPKTGSQNLGGASVTAGGLVFCAGTQDNKIRAFDTDTGEEIWSSTLPYAGYAAPAIYEVNGKEYVVIAASGGGKVGGTLGDAYVAFTLKNN